MTEKNILETFLENQSTGRILTKEEKGCEGFRNAVVILDKSKEAIDLERFQENPSAIRADLKFDDLRGFVDYINDFKGDNTVIFAKRNSITAIFDHHKKDAPKWGKHIATYDIKRSQRWSIWEGAHNKWMDQKSFAEFLDTGLNEITQPTQATILEMVKNFRATVNFEVDSEEGPGGTNFVYRKTTKGGTTKQEKIEVPEYLTITLQPFDNLTVINPQIKDAEKKIPAYELRAKINWRIDISRPEEQAIQFKIQILNFENAVDKTLEAIRVAMKELTEVKTYIG